jgi:adenylate cyclase
MTGTRHVWFSEAHDPGPINPAVVVRRQQYELDGAFIDEVFFNAGSQQSPQFLASPFYRVEADGELHAAIAPHGAAQPFPVFNDLAAIGCTAYFGRRLHGFAGINQKIGIAVDNPDGLSPQQVSDLRWSLSLLTLLLNTLIEYTIKNTLARVYIGHDPGRRVCGGMIELGKVVEIEGAIWFSDIHGFTRMSEEISAADLIGALNTYYCEVVGAIYDRGGEVLKYIGDAVLAVFPVQDFADARAACAAAYAAAVEARARLGKLERGGLEDGVALHYGVAQYGNIGADDRLDFTLIGREVNLAARLKPLAPAEAIVCTRAFRDRLGLDMRPLGRFEAKGLRDGIELFAP